MATFSVQVETPVEQLAVWDYVADIDRWAPLFPGYQRHLTVDEDQFEWHIRGDAGAWSRLVKFNVQVDEWQPPSLVNFRIRGITEPVSGKGRFTIEPTGSGSIMVFELDALAEGPTAPMINVILTTFLNDHSGAFLERLREAIEAANLARATKPRIGVNPLPEPGVVQLALTTPRTVDADLWLTEALLPALMADRATRKSTRLEEITDPAETGRLDTIVQIDTFDMASTVASLRLLIRGCERESIESMNLRFARRVSVQRRGLWARLFEK